VSTLAPLPLGRRLHDAVPAVHVALEQLDELGDDAVAPERPVELAVHEHGGDRVKLELSPYDLTRGRITYRDK
jgi:hypothetical protein